MREPNIPLLRKAVEWVEQQAALPEIDRQWEQGSYIRSGHHKAFHMLRMAMHARPTIEQVNQVAAHCGTVYCVAGYIGMTLDSRYTYNEIVDGVQVGEFAAEQLGITRMQADMLFDGSNSAERVRAVAENIAGEKL